MKWLNICLLFLVGTVASAQDYIDARPGKEGVYYFDLSVQVGQTLYSLANKVGTASAHLIKINNKSDASLAIDEVLILPLSPSKISKEKTAMSIPIFYTSRTGDNLFRIAQNIKRPLTEVMALNNKTSSNLSVGERVLLGWIDSPYTTASSPPQRQLTMVEELVANGSFSLITSVHPMIQPRVPDYAADSNIISPESVVTERGIAYWEKGDYSSQELIVMHPHAKLNSKISLYNPMLQRKVDAKVVGELPREAYPEEISVVISPSVASAMGDLE